MAFDFYLKCLFGLGIGFMAMVSLRDFFTAAKGSGSPPVDSNVADDACPFVPNEELFFDEEGPWRASQRSDELIQMNAELEKECTITANHSTFMP